MFALHYMTEANLSTAYSKLKAQLWHYKFVWGNKFCKRYIDEMKSAGYVTITKKGQANIHSLTPKGLNLLYRLEQLLRDARADR